MPSSSNTNTSNDEDVVDPSPSLARRQALREADAKALSSSSVMTVISTYPIEKYYAVANRLLESFTEAMDARRLDDAYVYGIRFATFSVQSLPKHSSYQQPSHRLARLRNNKQVKHVMDQMEQITERMDMEERVKQTKEKKAKAASSSSSPLPVQSKQKKKKKNMSFDEMERRAKEKLAAMKQKEESQRDMVATRSTKKQQEHQHQRQQQEEEEAELAKERNRLAEHAERLARQEMAVDVTMSTTTAAVTGTIMEEEGEELVDQVDGTPSSDKPITSALDDQLAALKASAAAGVKKQKEKKKEKGAKKSKDLGKTEKTKSSRRAVAEPEASAVTSSSTSASLSTPNCMPVTSQSTVDQSPAEAATPTTALAAAPAVDTSSPRRSAKKPPPARAKSSSAAANHGASPVRTSPKRSSSTTTPKQQPSPVQASVAIQPVMTFLPSTSSRTPSPKISSSPYRMPGALPSEQRTIQLLEGTIAKQEQRLEMTETIKIPTLRRMAKAKYKAGDRKAAIQCLVRKKKLEQNVETLKGAIFRMETQIIRLESAVENREVAKAMKAASEAMEALQTNVSADSLNEVMADMAHDVTGITNATATTATVDLDDLDEDALLAELQEDDDEEEEVDLGEKHGTKNKLNLPNSTSLLLDDDDTASILSLPNVPNTEIATAGEQVMTEASPRTKTKKKKKGLLASLF